MRGRISFGARRVVPVLLELDAKPTPVLQQSREAPSIPRSVLSSANPGSLSRGTAACRLP